MALYSYNILNKKLVSKTPPEIGRAIRCEVKSVSSWPEKPKQYPCVTKHAALCWIKEVGFDHVQAGNCDLLKCRTAKHYIDAWHVLIDEKTKKPRLRTFSEYLELESKKKKETESCPTPQSQQSHDFFG
ncbi:MAG: hypothetical protein AB7J46_06670 [Candidatus Altimarinota bacterium]